MKKVLISDNYPLFRDFLKQKLSEEQIEIITTHEDDKVPFYLVSVIGSC